MWQNCKAGSGPCCVCFNQIPREHHLFWRQGMWAESKMGRSQEVAGLFETEHGVLGGGERVREGQSPECWTTVHASLKLTHAPFIKKSTVYSWMFFFFFLQIHKLLFLQPKYRNLRGFHIDRYKCFSWKNSPACKHFLMEMWSLWKMKEVETEEESRGRVEKRASPVWTPSVWKMSHRLVSTTAKWCLIHHCKPSKEQTKSPSFKNMEASQLGLSFAPKVQHERAGNVSPCARELPAKSLAKRGSSKRRGQESWPAVAEGLQIRLTRLVWRGWMAGGGHEVYGGGKGPGLIPRVLM